jgi:hypothetical protein
MPQAAVEHPAAPMSSCSEKLPVALCCLNEEAGNAVVPITKPQKPLLAPWLSGCLHPGCLLRQPLVGYALHPLAALLCFVQSYQVQAYFHRDRASAAACLHITCKTQCYLQPAYGKLLTQVLVVSRPFNQLHFKPSVSTAMHPEIRTSAQKQGARRSCTGVKSGQGHVYVCRVPDDATYVARYFAHSHDYLHAWLLGPPAKCIVGPAQWMWAPPREEAECAGG